MGRLLPTNPSLVQFKNQAKDLLKSHHSGDPSGCASLRCLNRFKSKSDDAILQEELHLHDAQFAIALEYSFSSWNALKQYVERCRLTKNEEIFRRFTQRARKVVFDAQMSAISRTGDFVEPIDILIALVSQDDGAAVKILSALNVDSAKLSDEFPTIEPPNIEHHSDIQLSYDAKRVVDYTYDESKRLFCDYIGTEHLLLGLIRFNEENSNLTLEKLGLFLEPVREVIKSLIASGEIDNKMEPQIDNEKLKAIAEQIVNDNIRRDTAEVYISKIIDEKRELRYTLRGNDISIVVSNYETSAFVHYVGNILQKYQYTPSANAANEMKYSLIVDGIQKTITYKMHENGSLLVILES